MDLKTYIRDIPNYPIEGVTFKDITPLLKDYQAFSYCIESICEVVMDLDFDAVIVPEARGFIFGTAVAQKLNKAIIPVRKAGKLPFSTYSEDYELEYGVSTLEIHTDAMTDVENAIIIDDVLATGGTSLAIAKLVEKAGGNVVSIFNLIELSFLNGREKLNNYDVRSLISY